MTNPPKINPRFLYPLRFQNKKTFKMESHPALNSEGYVDYAHQIGLESVESQMVSQHTEIDENKAVTRWATVKVTVKLKNGVSASGTACVSSRDDNVKKPQYTESVAETRALKRAIAIAANLNESLINPDAKEPTVDMVESPLGEPEEEKEIPKTITKTYGEVTRGEVWGEGFSID